MLIQMNDHSESQSHKLVQETLDHKLDELTAANERLMQSESRTKAILHSISDGVAVANKHGKLELFNAAAEEILGRGLTESDPEEWHATYGLYLNDGETPCPTDQLPLVRALAGEFTDNFELIVSNHNKDNPVLISVTAAPITDEAGNNDGGVVVFKNITARKAAEEQLELQKEELAHMMRRNIMNEMASGMAHELNQPLSAIVNYVSGIARRVEESSEITNELRQAMQEVVNEATRASNIIAGLRRLVAKRPHNQVKAQLAEIVQKSIHICRIELQKHKVSINFENPVPSIQLLVDDVQIEQVVVCLIMNSIEALKSIDKSVREISIKISGCQQGNVTMTFWDSGPGIPEHQLEEVFQPYYSTKSNGMGMGLAISRSIIESHGGRIWAESDPNKTTLFQITLPLCTEERS